MKRRPTPPLHIPQGDFSQNRSLIALDRVSQVTFHDTSTIAYTYDAGDRITQIDGNTISITHASGQLDTRQRHARDVA